MSKVVLITGTSSGFGSYAAPLLADCGHKVYATMRDIKGRNRDAASALRSAHPNIGVLELEIADTDRCNEVVEEVVSNEGRIDVLINNAGRFYMGVGES